MRWILGVCVLLAACNTRPVCADGDLDCLGKAFTITDFAHFDDASAREQLTALVNPLPVGASSALTLSEMGALDFAVASDGALILMSWTDANGCRPSMCMSHCPRGVRCATGARCTPSRQDGLRSATTTHWIEYTSDPATDTDMDLVVTPASAHGCPIDVAALIDANDPSVSIGPAIVIPVHLPAPGGGGTSGTCPGGLEASTLSCTPLGSGGAADTCVSAAEYESIFNTSLPASCAPSGTSGCLDTQKGALVKPCCPGLSCNVGSACGGGSTFGGVCQ